MTLKIYLDSETKTIQAKVLDVKKDGSCYKVVLDRTIFHPQGGGQPSDEGRINNMPIIKVKEENNEVIHFIGTELSQHQEVELDIDEAKRSIHTQLHSIGHLIGNIGLHRGYTPSKAHHWPDEAKVEFEGINEEFPLDALYISNQVQKYIQQDLKRQQTTNQSGRRLVRFGDLPAWPCAGTHVISLSELPSNISYKVKNKKGKTVVSYSF